MGRRLRNHNEPQVWRRSSGLIAGNFKPLSINARSAGRSLASMAFRRCSSEISTLRISAVPPALESSQRMVGRWVLNRTVITGSDETHGVVPFRARGCARCCWCNCADIVPVVLYRCCAGIDVPAFQSSSNRPGNCFSIACQISRALEGVKQTGSDQILLQGTQCSERVQVAKSGLKRG